MEEGSDQSGAERDLFMSLCNAYSLFSWVHYDKLRESMHYNIYIYVCDLFMSCCDKTDRRAFPHDNGLFYYMKTCMLIIIVRVKWKAHSAALYVKAYLL